MNLFKSVCLLSHDSCIETLSFIADSLYAFSAIRKFQCSAFALLKESLYRISQPKWHRSVPQPHLAITSQPHALDVVTLTSNPHLLPLALFSTFDLLHIRYAQLKNIDSIIIKYERSLLKSSGIDYPEI